MKKTLVTLAVLVPLAGCSHQAAINATGVAATGSAPGVTTTGNAPVVTHGAAYSPEDPTDVSVCVNLWVKLHRAGLTAKVLADVTGKSAAPAESTLYISLSSLLLQTNPTCGVLNHADNVYATQRINALTGDHYVPGS